VRRTDPHRVTDDTRPAPPPGVESFEVGTPPSPCDGCSYAVTCRTRHLACRAFIQYTSTGRWKVKRISRLPRRRPYLRLFRH